jgi:hypothetical protein
MKSLGMPGIHVGAKLRRARCGGMLQASHGRPLVVAEWASSKACAEAWRAGYESMRASMARMEGGPCAK